MATKDDETELRGDVPNRIINMLDAVSAARRISRIKLVKEILSQWVEEQAHIARVVRRVVGDDEA